LRDGRSNGLRGAVLSFPRRRKPKFGSAGLDARVHVIDFGGEEGASQKVRNEKAVKPLKINDTAKSLIQRS
jgi:hypothetical protein